MTNPSPANAIGTAAEAERVIDSLNTVEYTDAVQQR